MTNTGSSAPQPLTLDEVLDSLTDFMLAAEARGLPECTEHCPRCECEDVPLGGPCAHCRMH